MGIVLGVSGTETGRGPVDWDAAAYARLSTPQQDWAEEVLSRLRLAGDETVLDLGCGAGIVTARLASLVPHGRVIAVDASAAMVSEARTRLAGTTASVLQADLRTFTWPDRADALLSTATLHWVPDHPALWRRLHAVLRPGGRLVVQYGGQGNIPKVEAAMADLAGRAPYAAYLEPFQSPWTFDSADAAGADCAAAGFTDVRAWTQERAARPADMLGFLTTSVAVTELDRLPQSQRARYVTDLHDLLGRPEELRYVRVNVDATA